MMSDSKNLKWEWKGSDRREWRIIANQLGEIENVSEMNPEGDLVWLWFVYDEAGMNCQTNQNYIWAGRFVGQGDHPPHLKLLLLQWLEDVNSVVVDGAISEAKKGAYICR